MVSSSTLLTISLVLDLELFIAVFGLLIWRSYELREELEDQTDHWRIQQLSGLVSIYVLFSVLSVIRIVLGIVMYRRSPTKKKANYILVPSVIQLILSIALVAAFKESKTIKVDFKNFDVKIYEAESPIGFIGMVFNMLFLIFGVCILRNLDKRSSMQGHSNCVD